MIPISTPDELTSDVPRAVRFTTTTQAARLFLLVLLLFAVGLLWWLANRDLGDLNTLKVHGHPTLAHVVGKHVTHGKSNTYYLDYDFHEEGVWVDGDKAVDQDEYADTLPGETLPVTFLPSHPETYRLGAVTQDRIEARQGRWLWGRLAAFVFFGLLLAVVEGNFRRHLALLRDGSVAAGTVTDRSITPISSSQKAFYVTYQFTAEGRFAVVSRSYLKKVTCTQRFYEQTELGQVLTILYHPARPSHSIPYRLLTDVALPNRGKTA